MSARKWLNLKLAGFPRLRRHLSQWVNIMSEVASKVVHHVSGRAPPRPLSAHQMSCSLSRSLMECGARRAVIISVLHHPAGQNGRDDTGDLWIIYQRWRLSHRIKNVALAQMTFSSSARPDCTMPRGPTPHCSLISPLLWALTPFNMSPRIII